MYKETIPWEVNYDVNEIPAYTLPDILICQDGTTVKTTEDWEKKRRPELLQMFKEICKLTQKPEIMLLKLFFKSKEQADFQLVLVLILGLAFSVQLVLEKITLEV